MSYVCGACCVLNIGLKTMSNLKQTIKFFSKSNKAVAELQKARNDVDITQGLVKIGKTRFATHWSAAVALDRCLPLIKELISKGVIPLPVRTPCDS
jgi:hypothetical protein